MTFTYQCSGIIPYFSMLFLNRKKIIKNVDSLKKGESIIFSFEETFIFLYEGYFFIS